MRRCYRIPVVMLMLALPAQLAWGAEHAEAEVNLFGGDLVISLCTVLIFVLVLVVLGKFAWGPMLTALQNRERFIRESLASAKHDREEAEAKLEAYEQKLEQAHREASALVEEGRSDAEAVRRQIEASARADAEAIAEQAKRDIEVARDAALAELNEQSARLAMTMAEAVLKRQLSPEDHERLVRDALAGLDRQSISGN